MILELYLDEEQTDQLLTVHDLLDDDTKTVEDYANELFGNLLANIWDGVTKDILN